MQYITKKCPHCNHSYVINEIKNTSHYGSPIRTCNFCGKIFVDKDFIEIAVSGIHERDERKISITSLLSVFMGIVCAIFFLTSFDIDIFSIIISALAVLIPVWLAYSDFKEYGERQAFLKREKHASEQRLKNHEYALMLKEFGYDVPSKYLKQDKE